MGVPRGWRDSLTLDLTRPSYLGGFLDFMDLHLNTPRGPQIYGIPFSMYSVPVIKVPQVRGINRDS